MSRKHLASTPGPPHARGIAVALAVLLATGLIVAVVVALRDQPSQKSTQSTAGAELGGASRGPSQPASSATPTTSALALKACKAEVAAAQAAADSAHQSYADWSTHVQAQVDLDGGRINEDQAWNVWLDTKARGTADLAAFDRALQTYNLLKGSCAGVGDGEADATSCATRVSMLDAAISTGEKMNADWGRHVQMMLEMGKSSMGYNQMWRQMVASAPQNLEPFKAAYDAVSTAPACELPG